MRRLDAVKASILVACLTPSAKPEGIKGRVEGSISAKGPLSRIITQGRIQLEDVSLPQYQLSQLSGQIETPKWVLSANPSQAVEGIGLSSTAKLHLNTLSSGNLHSSDLNADIVFDYKPGDNTQKISIKNGQSALAGGSARFSGWLNLSNQKLHLECSASKVDADSIISTLVGHSDEMMGKADAEATLDSQGSEYKSLIHNLDGQGYITIFSGTVARFGQLQEKLTQANLIHQGIFGFNLNNLLQSMVPVRTGKFHDLHSSFQISSGKIAINQLLYNGEDLQLRAKGSINLPLNTIQIEVVGEVPRVASSIIRGPFGQVSRRFTIQNVLHTVTMHKLENLPSLPILGEIASDRPRVFGFQIAAPANQPHAVAQSIEKTFHWLPAHPANGNHQISNSTDTEKD